MPNVGTLAEIHRYPVKSMLGEELDETLLGENGLPGDRAWATRDEARGSIQGGKKIPGLMSCAARYLEAPKPQPAHAPAPEIRLADGTTFRASDPDAGKRISEAVGREVSLWPLVPAEQIEHYQRGAPDSTDVQAELRAIFGRLPEEPLPDLGAFPRELFQYQSPPGTYFDAFPLLVLSAQSLASLAARAPESRIDVRRFRPNLVVSTASAADPAAARDDFPEQAWAGRRLRIGDAEIAIEMTCPRCVMTTHPVADLPKDPGVMRALVREAEGNLGVYARVVSPGSVRRGDPLELLD